MFKVKSNVLQQNPRSKSLRTTIPSEICGVLGLQNDDKLIWDVNLVNEELTVLIKKE